MIRKTIQSVAAIAVVLLLMGFGAGTPIRNVIDAPIPPHPAATMENLEKAVVRAGLTLGWRMTPKGPGKVEGVLDIRKHQAIIDVTFDTKTYSITYRDSTNLDYKPENKTIHSNYNGWIQNLDKAIRAQVSVL
jgi:hypothetical protein